MPRAPWCRRQLGVIACLAIGAAGCATDGGGPGLVQQAALRGPAVAFESIDGPPVPVFRRLVVDLVAEAESRQILVVSRESPAAFRVRGYLAANVVQGRTHFDWVWDVYDADKRRILRIAGQELGAGRAGDAWASLDDATLDRVARASMDRLAQFLGSPDLARPRDAGVRAFAAEGDRPPLVETSLAGTGPAASALR